MTVAGTILAVLGTLLIPFGAYGLVFLVAHLEHRACARAHLKLLEKSLGDWADGDWPAIPDDLKLSHSGTCSTEA